MIYVDIYITACIIVILCETKCLKVTNVIKRYVHVLHRDNVALQLLIWSEKKQTAHVHTFNRQIVLKSIVIF